MTHENPNCHPLSARNAAVCRYCGATTNLILVTSVYEGDYYACPPGAHRRLIAGDPPAPVADQTPDEGRPEDEEAARCFTLLDADDCTEVEHFEVLVDRPPILVVARFTFPAGVGYEVHMSPDLEGELEELSCIPEGARVVQWDEVVGGFAANGPMYRVQYWLPILKDVRAGQPY